MPKTSPELQASAAGPPPIPLHPVSGPADLLHLEPARLAALLAAAERRYPKAGIALADRLSRRWLEKSANPYLDEIEAVARTLGPPGAHFLNISYEWACTCSVGPNAAGTGSRLTRVLDWPFDGLGAQAVAARHSGPAGAPEHEWINLTWPGFSGCIQGHAPGRFAAAFNQAPLRRRSPSKVVDWACDRYGLWRSRALPPAHLLRRVFDEAPDFTAARWMLAETPLALPAIFSLVGTGPEEQAVIERLEDHAVIHDGPQVAANHWTSGELPRARERGTVSGHRAEVMRAEAAAAGPDFAWLKPPVLNPTTRLALYAEPASGRLVAQGFEAEGTHNVVAATAVTEILAGAA
ncbi:MAG: hypothetical protein Tsb0032_11880 [Kiloniellaceae bacterium]